ncbi:MAG: hypothetical protein K2I51_08145, partial [Muribaculaceae bacterium]|nr:hypothetical protein [Muribaculaceae bacterium]
MHRLSRLYCLLIILSAGLLITPATQADRPLVKGIDLDFFDLTAKRNPRQVAPEKYCALMKILKPNSRLSFEGDIVGPITVDGAEYSVYLSPSAKNLTIIGDNDNRTVLNFADYDLLPLIPNAVYTIIISDSDMADSLSAEERVRRFKPLQITDDERDKLSNEYTALKATRYKDADSASVLNWFKSLADRGYRPIYEQIGQMLVSHYDRPRPRQENRLFNPAEGEYYLSLATEYTTSHSAPLSLARYYHYRHRFDKANELYFTAYSRGSREAAAELARMYEAGIGCEKDEGEALRIWRELYWNAPNRSYQDRIEDNFKRLKTSPYLLQDYNSPEVKMMAGQFLDTVSAPEAIIKEIAFTRGALRNSFVRVSRQSYPYIYTLLCAALTEYDSLEAARELYSIIFRETPVSIHFYTDLDTMYPRPLPDIDIILKKIIELIEKKVSAGNLNAIALQADMYGNGHFYNQDREKALELYRKGAVLGSGE